MTSYHWLAGVKTVSQTVDDFKACHGPGMRQIDAKASALTNRSAKAAPRRQGCQSCTTSFMSGRGRSLGTDAAEPMWIQPAMRSCCPSRSALATLRS